MISIEGEDLTDNTAFKIGYPLDVIMLQRHQKKMRRSMKKKLSGPKLRVAILGGSTTNDVANYIELFLLNEGINVDIYQSDYNQFYQAVSILKEADQTLVEFRVSLSSSVSHVIKSSMRLLGIDVPRRM